MRQLKNKNKKFEELLSEQLKETLLSILKNKEKRKILIERIRRFLFKNDLLKEDIPIELLTNREKFIKDILDDYYEILSSLENIEMINIFLRRYPNYKIYVKKITKAKYLSYHLGNYFNEIYIFEKRVESFLNKLEKKLKVKGLNKDIKKIEKLKNILYRTLEKSNTIRGIHIHKYRFNTIKLEKLDALERWGSLIDKDEYLETISHYKNIFYNDIRKKWLKIIDANKNTLKKLLDYILEEIKLIVFNKLIFYYKNGSEN